MGGKPPKKRETNDERNARIAAGQKAGTDARDMRLRDAAIARSRRRSPLFGGPETGMTTLGGARGALGVG